jgi:diacylglycerol kinase family enzyme
LDFLVLMNPSSRRFTPDEVRNLLDERLKAAGISHRVVELPKDAASDSLENQIRSAIDEGCQRVVAVGGDGNCRASRHGARGRRRHRARDRARDRPGGTANVLAHELGVPGDLGGAIDVLVDGRTLALDAIQIGEKHVLTQIGIGPDALMIQETSRKKTGRLDYIRSFVRHGLRHRPRLYHLEVDGRRGRCGRGRS